MTSAKEAARNRTFADGSSQPVFFAVCAFSAGIVIGTYTWRPMSWWLITALVFFLSAAYLWARRSLASAMLALLTLVALGTLHAQLDLASPAPLADISPFADEREHTVVAHVLRNGLIKTAAVGAFSGDA